MRAHFFSPIGQPIQSAEILGNRIVLLFCSTHCHRIVCPLVVGSPSQAGTVQTTGRGEGYAAGTGACGERPCTSLVFCKPQGVPVSMNTWAVSCVGVLKMKVFQENSPEKIAKNEVALQQVKVSHLHMHTCMCLCLTFGALNSACSFTSHSRFLCDTVSGRCEQMDGQYLVCGKLREEKVWSCWQGLLEQP